MANTITGISANVSHFNNGAMRTMSSREIAELTNKDHRHVLADIRKMFDELGETSAGFSADLPDAYGRPQPAFNLPKRETLILVSGYSIELRARIIDRWQELEARATLSHATHGVLREELEAVDVLARILNVAPSGKLGIVKASLTHHGATHLVSALPVYAIDAPPTATGEPTSSMPTASLTVLLAEHDIGMTARTANKMMEKAGILVEMTRPSSRGTSHKFWSVTDAGLKYGKNVVSPSNPKETQPHWYKATFKELVRTHMVGF